MQLKWMILRWSKGDARWEETSWRADSRQKMEYLLPEIQRRNPGEEFCAVPDPLTIAHKSGSIQVWDYQGVGKCWDSVCDGQPSYEVTWQARTTLVCHRHITRFLRAHTELKNRVS